jgi:hypothetical protein
MKQVTTLCTVKPRSVGRERVDVARVLLTMQSALGLLSVAGTIVFAGFARALPLFAGAIVIGLIGPALALMLASGLGRLKRWARNGVIAYEALVVLAAAARFLIGKSLSIQLVPVMTTLLLPLAIAGLIASRSVWRLFAHASAPARMG